MRISFSLSMLLAMALLSVSPLPVQAHFVWVSLSGGDGSTASLFFGEGPEPGEAYLLDKVAQSEAFARTADGDYVPLKLEKQVEGLNGSWTTSQAEAGWQTLEAICNYGVLEKGDAPFWLKYYAKYVDAAAIENETLRASRKLPLDVIPVKIDGGIELTVQFAGEPVEGAEVVITDDIYNESTHQTDASGKVLLENPKSVTYSIRARWIEESAGENEGKKYESVRHYSTVALNLTSSSITTAAKALSATELLAQSRAARAVWNDFPGFTARLTVSIDDQTQEGTLRVAQDGRIDLEGFRFARGQSPVRTLRSLVGHRLPGSSLSEEATYVADAGETGLGTLVQLQGDGMGSHYRIQGDVITEVNRTLEEGRFSISVLSVHRNAEGKYLPEMFVVDSWDQEGELTSSATHHVWQRIGKFDLPQQMTVIRCGRNKRTVTKLVWSDIQLGDQ